MANKKYIDMKENDFVECHLYPDLSTLSVNIRKSLDDINKTWDHISSLIGKISENYIWHNERIRIFPKNLVSHSYSSEEKEAFSFYGSLNYAENIEDEWFLVYILMELTKQVKDLVVSIKDSDGEFLLIEAAEYLPPWVSPENCEDRVFIYKGHLQILPQSFMQNNENFVVTQEVINYVRQNTEKTRVDEKVQTAIEKRIAGYPGKINDNFHKVNVYVPVAVAALLNAKPSLIASAVRAFYERDLLDIKACQAMKYFPPENRVQSNVKFTRCLYAMLATSKYLPDKRTGWNLPQSNDISYKSHLLGVKVACGFEILISQVRGKANKDEEMEESHYAADPNWQKFLKSLSSKNYFRGLLQHSKEHDELLEKAREFYRKSCQDTVKPNVPQEICKLLDDLEVDVEELRRREKNLPKSDNDDWMSITEEDLDAMLEARFGRTGQIEGDLVNGNNDIAHHLKSFINHMSGLEGAEFPKSDDKSAGRPKCGVKTKKSKTVKFSPDTKLHGSTSDDKISTTKTNKINFEPDGFINAIQNILDFSIPDDNYWDSDGSGMSSYEDETDMELGESKPTSSKKDKDLFKYMRQMDKELVNTAMEESFVKVNGKAEDTFDEVENFTPVDIDKNALKNILSSYQAQLGCSGPAENLLGPMGVKLDFVDDSVD
ncbi:hypothetical protein RUM44_003103 [Polyplax serrata]|uniref:Uncharacterized protein n=1 Tax=Polyplax serrata TaxID=468196 RepID=A0ABR1AXL5_POLSC